MSLMSETTPDIIANTIRMDKYCGYTILVEGVTDERFFAKFFNTEITQIHICDGKQKLLQAVAIVNKGKVNKNKIIGIIDKDYDFLNEALAYPNNIIQTDFHDVEMMCLHAESFDHFWREYFSTGKVEGFILKKKEEIREYLLNLIVPISKLRILNLEKKMGLAFKPKNKEKKLDYKKFICRRKFEFKGYEDLIDAVKRYKNQATNVVNDELKNELDGLQLEKYDCYDLCHGHDLTYTIAIGLKCCHGNGSPDEKEVERGMRLSYSLVDFKKTKMSKVITTINDELLKN